MRNAFGRQCRGHRRAGDVDRQRSGPGDRGGDRRPEVAGLADRVAELGAGTEPPEGKVCGAVENGTTNEDFLVERVGDQTVFDGVWRLDATAEDFKDAGVGASEAQLNAGSGPSRSGTT